MVTCDLGVPDGLHVSPDQPSIIDYSAQDEAAHGQSSIKQAVMSAFVRDCRCIEARGKAIVGAGFSGQPWPPLVLELCDTSPSDQGRESAARLLPRELESVAQVRSRKVETE